MADSIFEQVINMRLQQARDIHSNWVKNNPLLLSGEVAVVFDVDHNANDTRTKTGDGVHRFNDLPWDSDNTKINVSELGKANGIAQLDENGKILASQIPAGFGTGGSSLVKISNVPSQTGTLTYTGEVLTPTWQGFDTEMFIQSGTIEARDAGTYNASFRPAPGYCWTDETADLKYVEWTIQRAVVQLPEVQGTYTFNDTDQTVEITGYDELKMVKSGTETALHAGTYDINYTPTINYKWPDGSTTAKTVQWTIEKEQGWIRLTDASGNPVTSITLYV